MIYPNKQAARVALITGGARRIGAALVKKLHQAEFKVVIHCRNALIDAHALAADLNQQRMDSALVLQQDLTQPGAADKVINRVIEWVGRLDLLINNASIFSRTENGLFNESAWQILFDTNVKAPFALSLAGQPFLKIHNGSIINITDIHAERPLTDYSAYCQSKAALEMQTKALAREFAPDIRVNSVAPGAIVWPETNNRLSEEKKQKIIAKTPLKCHGHPDYIAQAVLALVGNPFITGQIIKVDGGRSLA